MSDPSVPSHAPDDKNNPGKGSKDPSIPSHAPESGNKPGETSQDHSVPSHAPSGGQGASDKKKEAGVPRSVAEPSITDHAPEPNANPGYTSPDHSVPDHAPGQSHAANKQQAPEDPDRVRLRNHFAANPTDSTLWDKLHRDGFSPWDRSTVNPALLDLLASRPPTLPVLNASIGVKRPRALVPGCGKGYDVFLLAAWGFDAVGLEISGEAAGQARAEGSKVDKEVEGGGTDVYNTKDEKRGRGSWKIVEGDFFDDSWAGDGFDIIYDYTFFCALPPQLRPKWSASMARLLRPEGRLICLEFPTYKDPSSSGPPWAVRPKEYVAYLSRPGEKVTYGEDGFVKDVDEEDPTRSSSGLIRVAHFQPERTHKIGQGTDWISIWQPS